MPSIIPTTATMYFAAIFLASLLLLFLTTTYANARETPFNLAWSKIIKGETSPHSISISFGGGDDNSKPGGATPAAVAVIVATGYGYKEGAINYLDNHGNLVWTFKTDRRISQTFISSNGSHILAAGFQFSEGRDRAYANGEIYCLDNKGNLLWNYTTRYEPVWSFSASSDGHYMLVSTINKLLFFDAWKGKILWTFDPQGGDDNNTNSGNINNNNNTNTNSNNIWQAQFGGITMSSDGKYAFAGATITTKKILPYRNG